MIFRLAYDDNSVDKEENPTEIETENKEKKEKVKTYSQEEVNSIMAKEKRSNQQNREKLIQELTSLKDTAKLTIEEKDQLTTRIEQLQNETLTAQELAKREKDKLVKDHTKELTRLQTETTFWRDKYSREKIEREIIDAAISEDAVSPSQIVNLVSGKTKLVEELKEGKPTGEWTPKVSFSINDDDGSVKILDLNVREAIKRMKDMQEHWNLFKNKTVGGVGSYNQPANNTLKGKSPPSDPTEYRKWRAENLAAKGRRGT